MLRQLASYLAIAIWMMDAEGNLVFYNEPAERLLGVEFDAVGPIRAEQVGEVFEVCDEEGNPLSHSDVPIVRALTDRAPYHRKVRIRGLDGVWRSIEASAIPLEGQGARFLGAFATFWEAEG